MKKGIVYILLLAIILPIAYSEEWLFNHKTLDLNLKINSEMVVEPTSSNYEVSYIIANVSFVPKDRYNQKIKNIIYEPNIVEEANNIVFRWDNPTETKLKFGINADIELVNIYNEVKGVVYFPLKDVPEEILIYTQPSSTIDSDSEEIIKLASSIARGKHDLYEIVYSIGAWVKTNINYDLNTITESASQKASWVLANREGVCDEITNLFIALNRALGIPAKFISGVSYTGSLLVEENWGPHGWAEVYFPGYGWIPFDITYGEFGFVNMGHIKLKESLDANEPATRYQWYGKNVDLKTQKLNFDVEVKGSSGSVEDFIALKPRVVKDDVDFGSYSLVEAEAENLKDSYVSTELFISTPQEVTIEDESSKLILLKPKEKKKIYWILKVKEDLERIYKYKMPLSVNSLRNVTERTNLISSVDGAMFTKDDINNFLKQIKEEETTVYSKNVELDCGIDKKEFQEYEDATISCSIKNTGNDFIEGLNICLEEECRTINLGINQQKQLSFSANKENVGKQDAIIKATGEDVSKAGYVRYTVYDLPEIGISDLRYPENVSYNEEYNVSFFLNKKSFYNPKNVEVTLKQGSSVKGWSINELSEERQFIVSLNSRDLSGKENVFFVIADYKDNNNKAYKTQETFIVRLENLSLWQNIIITTKSVIRNFVNLDPALLVGIFLIFLIAFLLLIRYIYKRKKSTYKKKKVKRG